MSRLLLSARRIGMLGLVGLTMSQAALIPMANADQTLLSPKEPLNAKLNTGLKVDTAHFGDAFEAVLTEAYRYKNQELPSGTVLAGQVHAARQSMPFALPGYVSFDVKTVKFPNGAVYQFDDKGQPIKTKKVLDSKAHTPKGLMQSTLPFTAVSLATSLPLRYAADMSSGVILPIALGARMALGLVLEKTAQEKAQHDEAHSSSQMRVAHGLFRGTGIPGVYHFLKPSAEPDLAEGTVIPLRFDEQGLNSLFASGSHAVPETLGTAVPMPPAPAIGCNKVLPVPETLGTAVPMPPLVPDQQEFNEVYAKLGKASSDAVTPPVSEITPALDELAK